MEFPSMMLIRQNFETPQVQDIPTEVDHQLKSLNLRDKVRPGETVAITVGSRGIANIATITKAICDCLKKLEAIPFIVPAMGSHGGGTVVGQTEILCSYGVTEESMGVEIRASMETVVVDRTSQGIPVHFDRHAYEADHVLVVGRVKPHTGFVGEIESGLHKMMLIGLGKHEGAILYHRAIQDYSFLVIIKSVADVVIKKCGILAGLAIVENAFDETGLLEAVSPENFFVREKELLKLAVQWMPKLPFPEIDLLIVDAIGKNISGTGMDTNVVGRKYNDKTATEKDNVRCKRIFARGLTEETHGNALGLGIAEFTTQRVVDGIDFHAMNVNALTGGHPSSASIPMTFPTDRDAVEAALGTVGMVAPKNARVIRIANTQNLETIQVSEPFFSEVNSRDDLESQRAPTEMQFDGQGFLEPLA